MIASGAIVGNAGGPYKSFKGAVNVHNADVHEIPINELFHRHTGVLTTIAATVNAGDTSIVVASGVGFPDSSHIQIQNGEIETTLPTIISGGLTTTFVLDRPLDYGFSIGDSVELVETNIAVLGSLAAPVAFRLIPNPDKEWHITRFLLGMVHTTEADDSLFGGIAQLQNGCVLRLYKGAADQYRTFTDWKVNGQIKMDMFEVAYTDKAGGGKFGTNAQGSIRIGTGVAPHLVGSEGDYLELLVQDDLTGLDIFQLKGQGHVEGY